MRSVANRSPCDLTDRDSLAGSSWSNPGTHLFRPCRMKSPFRDEGVPWRQIAGALGRGRICELVPFHSRPRRQHVPPHANAARDLACGDAPDQKRVGNQGSMTTPRDGLGAHQYNTRALGQIDAPVQVPSEHRRLHVVRVSAEARISPTTVCGVPPRVPQATQAGHVPVMNPSAT